MSRQKRFEGMLAWILAIMMSITLIPISGEVSYAEEQPEQILTPEEVTEENVTEKDLDTTTYDLGDGQKMTVFHGENVRFEDEDGKLIDYDPSLREETEMEDYALTNTAGDVRLFVPETIDEETPLLLGDDNYQIASSLIREA
ncbi:MAG: hypothetical protein IJJ30_00015 [Erysipelotrichaceae bacterium]|nr:hypothetical protein [Erysipelotrichaceae bacterium]MBQ6495984.1 hypothetical protein [Bacillota bacterium]